MTYDELIKHFGTQQAAAKALRAIDPNGISQPQVSEWRRRGIPAPRQAQYELLTKGALRADRPRAERRARA